MSGKLTDYLRESYPNSKTDLYSVFIERCGLATKNHCYRAMITQHGWMFLSSFEKLRTIIENADIICMAHLGARAFDEISGEVVQTTTFITRNTYLSGYKGVYVRLLSAISEEGKENLFLSGKYRYQSGRDCFDMIPGKPVAYWFSNQLLSVFINQTLADVAKPRQGLATGDNDRFLRLWPEVNIQRIGFGCKSREDAQRAGSKWFPCNKGGSYRKWYGNNDYIVNWENDGTEIKNNYDENGRLKSRPQNIDYYFREGMTWSTIASGDLAMRYSPIGHMFETKGSVCFPNNKSQLLYLLGMTNTPIVSAILSVLSPTLDFHEGPLGKVPAIIDENRIGIVTELVKNCVEISKEDWDSFETSWNFEIHPLVQKAIHEHRNSNSVAIKECYCAWAETCDKRYSQLKGLEEKVNELFIDIYGLQGELSPDVDEKKVTVRRADLQRDVKSLLSYAVGCMFGRYSLDVEGLAYAGGQWDSSKYTSFIPDADNVIPITDEEYLEDDVVGRLCEWLKVVYGAETLEENLDFIAKALGNKGNSSREIIRNYFLTDFFKDHCQTYSVTGSGKRPIYWLFDSGKQNGFKALVYLHRYNADTIGNLRIDYLHRMQRVYESEIGRMQDMIDHSTNAREVGQATKRGDKLTKQLKECREYDEKLAHLALSRIELDLDDGVKVNYRKVQTANDGKFYEVLADSKNIMAKK